MSPCIKKRLSVFFVLSCICVSTALADQSAWRHTTFLIHSNGQTQQLEGRLFSQSGGNFNAEIQILNDRNEEICKGIFGSKGRFFVLNQLKCLFSNKVYEEVVLVQKNRFGVVNHYVSIMEEPAGKIGIIVHMGNENSLHSTSKVDLKDVETLYGKFPNWILPKP